MSKRDDRPTPFHPGRSNTAKEIALQQYFASVYKAQHVPVPEHIQNNLRALARATFAEVQS